MSKTISALADLARELNSALDLGSLLTKAVDGTAHLMAAPRVSLRLLGAGDLLLATARAGQPLHEGSGAEFHRGEGLVGWVAQQAEPLLAANAESDPRFVARPRQIDNIGSFLAVPLFDQGHVIGVLSCIDSAPARFNERDQQLLTVIAALCAHPLCLARLERLAELDTLTSLPNRLGLRRTMRLQRVRSAPTSVVLADLDEFKQINDTHGHAIGDVVLREVAGALQASLRSGDVVTRYGGEEFLFVLPHATEAEAAIIAERARSAVAALSFTDRHGVPFRVTLSAGVALRAPKEPTDAAIGRADDALYRAKHAGRDRVVVASTQPAE